MLQFCGMNRIPSVLIVEGAGPGLIGHLPIGRVDYYLGERKGFSASLQRTFFRRFAILDVKSGGNRQFARLTDDPSALHIRLSIRGARWIPFRLGWLGLR